MSIEEFGDREMADAMRRDVEGKERDQIAENEDSDNEETSERNRLKTAGFEDWKDDNEKGTGNTSHI